MSPLEKKVDTLEKELAQLRANRFANLSARELESLVESVFQRTAATLASGAAVDAYLIMNYKGRRRVIPSYDNFEPLA